jgi:RNA polymerase sigma-70 factor (ECF subfamily)
MEKSDSEAVMQALAGDSEAFGLLVERYHGALAAFAYDRLGTVAEAQDAVQETFLRAFRQLHSLREPERFSAWAYEILRNRCAEILRRKGLERRNLEEIARERAGRAQFQPLDRLDEDEKRLQLRESLAKLSPVLRETLVLRYFGGVSRNEAAAILEIGLDALDKRLERGLRELRGLMER